MAVPCARNAPDRPERIPRGFVTHKAPRQGGGFAAHGARVCGARCAPLQGVPKGGCWGKRAARCLQPAETVAANIVRHGGFLREKRTGPAGTHPPRFCGARGTAAGRWVHGARVHGFVAHKAPRQGDGFAVHGAARHFSRSRSGFIVHDQGGVQVEIRWSSDEDSEQSMNEL